MDKLRRYFSSLKLNNKFTFLIIVALIFPIIVLSFILFKTFENSSIKESTQSAETDIFQDYHNIEKNVELCNMSTQVILNSQNLTDYLIKFNQNDVIDTQELIYFYKNDIGSLEKIVNSNPYLYQIHIYVDSDKMQEMMPILYCFSRMKRLDWAKDGNIKSGMWYFDYTDNLFPNHTIIEPTKNVVSLVTEITDHELGVIGVIEVATKMETLFPDIYNSNDENWTCFVDKNGKYYYDKKNFTKWNEHAPELFENIKNETAESVISNMTLDDTRVVAGYISVKELNGYLVKIVSIEDNINNLHKYRFIFLICLIIIFIILAFLFNKIVKVMLKQFYAIINILHIVQKGNLNVRVPDCGEDEIGEIGNEINEMLSKIKKLMEDSISREVLVKDSEIRALQNQINTHFIYNVLESIKMMAEIDEKYDISDAVTALGKLLRYSMKWVSKNVTIVEEIDYIKNYLALINLRFDYEIYLSLNIPDELWRQEIPKMSLQPIVENAIYHGIEELAEDTTIYIKGIVMDSYCIIEITDSGIGMTKDQRIQLQKKIDGKIETTGSSGNGIGLKNVQDRIKISFGTNYGISIASKKDCYTKVIVKIPYKAQ